MGTVVGLITSMMNKSFTSNPNIQYWGAQSAFWAGVGLVVVWEVGMFDKRKL